MTFNSDEQLKELVGTLIGNPFAKVQFFVAPNSQIFDVLLSVNERGSVETINTKLDLLLLLINFEQNIRDKLGVLYVDVVRRIMNEFEPHMMVSIGNATTTYKFAKLISLCVKNCPICEYPHAPALQDTLMQLIKNENDTKDEKNALIMFLDVCLRLRKQYDLNWSLIHIPNLEMLILRIISKYLDQVDFKYVLPVRTSKNKKLDYSPFSNKGLKSVNIVPNSVDIPDPLDRQLLASSLVFHSNILQENEDKNEFIWGNPYANLFILS